MGKNIFRTKRPLGYRDGQRISIVASLWNKKIPRGPSKTLTLSCLDRARLRRQQKLRRTNKYLLELAKQDLPMYDPPSTDEVKDFIHQSKNRKINHGD